MYELSTQIREVIDRSAPPISLEEVSERIPVGAVRRRHPRGRAPLVVAVAAGVAVVVAGGLAFYATTGNSRDRAEITTKPRAPQSCVIRRPNQRGCARTIREAQRQLGIPIQKPRYIPRGWAIVRREIRVYPAHGAINHTAEDTVDYSQIWAPKGVLGPNRLGPPEILALVARAKPARRVVPLSVVHTLPDGTAVGGSMGNERVGQGTGRIVNYANLNWTAADGVTYYLTARGVTDAEVFGLLDSLH